MAPSRSARPDPLPIRLPLAPWPTARRVLAAVALLLALATVAAAALKVPPPPDRRLSDYARALTPVERDRLERKLAARERGTSNQVVVAVFRSLEGESLEEFSIRLAQAWRIGQKGLDNGVIFLVFLDDRKMRIEVGYGLEASLTDATASSIIRSVVAPRFREGRIADGIGAGIDAIDQAIAGTYRGPGTAPARRPSYWTLIPALIVAGGLLWVIIPALFSASVKRQRGWTGGSSGWGGGSGGPFIGGGHSGGGFGGGGFSGGGGGFGGGGASGSW